MNQVIISTTNSSPEDDLDALHYEIWMLNYTIKLRFPISSKERKIISNALVESFLVHARNLIDFLEKDKQQDDIVCSDFEDTSGNSINKIQVNLQSDMKIHMNKYVNHLTETRRNTKAEWIFEDIKKEINISLKVFFDQLSDQYFPTQGGRDKNSFVNLLI